MALSFVFLNNAFKMCTKETWVLQFVLIGFEARYFIGSEDTVLFYDSNVSIAYMNAQ